MSAFLCSDLHTAVCALAVNRLLPNCKKSAEAIFRDLRSLNSAALVARYGDKKAVARNVAFHLEQAQQRLNAHPCEAYRERVLLSLLECLEYQCSEGDVMETHKAAPMLTQALEAAQVAAKGHRAPNVWSI